MSNLSLSGGEIPRPNRTDYDHVKNLLPELKKEAKLDPMGGVVKELDRIVSCIIKDVDLYSDMLDSLEFFLKNRYDSIVSLEDLKSELDNICASTTGVVCEADINRYQLEQTKEISNWIPNIQSGYKIFSFLLTLTSFRQSELELILNVYESMCIPFQTNSIDSCLKSNTNNLEEKKQENQQHHKLDNLKQYEQLKDKVKQFNEQQLLSESLEKEIKKEIQKNEEELKEIEINLEKGLKDRKEKEEREKFGLVCESLCQQPFNLDTQAHLLQYLSNCLQKFVVISKQQSSNQSLYNLTYEHDILESARNSIIFIFEMNVRLERQKFQKNDDLFISDIKTWIKLKPEEAKRKVESVDNLNNVREEGNRNSKLVYILNTLYPLEEQNGEENHFMRMREKARVYIKSNIILSTKSLLLHWVSMEANIRKHIEEKRICNLNEDNKLYFSLINTWWQQIDLSLLNLKNAGNNIMEELVKIQSPLMLYKHIEKTEQSIENLQNLITNIQSKLNTEVINSTETKTTKLPVFQEEYFDSSSYEEISMNPELN